MDTKTLQIAVTILKRGGIIAYPTEAVYGLGCDPRNKAAVQRLLDIKQRGMDKGLILIAASLEQLKPYVQELGQKTQRLVLPTWPGPVTWLLPARSLVPRWLRGSHNKIAVRVTAHPPAIELCNAWGGALISTSANPSNHPPALNPSQVNAYFGANIDSILEGAIGTLAGPTEIRDGDSGEIIRAG